jgi:hypothetical protein
MKYISFMVLFSACQLFHDDESIQIHKPEVGQTIEIRTMATPQK